MQLQSNLSACRLAGREKGGSLPGSEIHKHFSRKMLTILAIIGPGCLKAG